MEYGPRYAKVVRGFKPIDLAVAERLSGDATTDFGAPGAAPSADSALLTDADRRRFQTLLRACWRALDKAAEAAKGKELRKGPRGGGRALGAILDHVADGERGYLGSVGVRVPEGGDTRSEVLKALGIDIVPVGPRGGKRWTHRYLVRRVAWHILDHAWEIEDRIS